jgi:O-antigen/teichoic acid export membrane protein
MTGTTIAQAIPIAISPILTRIYTPEDFGLFALYMSVASLISAAATGRYATAIILPKKDEDAINIAFFSIIISFIISFLSLVFVWIFNDVITSFLGNKEISSWLYFIPVTVLFTGLYQVLNFWTNRKKKYKELAFSRVAQNTSMTSVHLGMGFSNFGAGGLIVGTILGQGVAVFLLMKKTWQRHINLTLSINKLKTVALMKKYKKFPLLNLPNAIVDEIRLSGINMMIAKFFTTATLGQFSLAWRMIQAPMSLLGSSLSQVFFQKLSTSKKTTLHQIVKKFILRILLIATPIFLFIYLFANTIFIFVFGESWKLAGESASIMAPWLFLNFITSPLSNIFLILNKQELMLYFSILYAIIPLGILYFFNDHGYLEILQIVTFCMCLLLLIFIFMVLFLTKKEII